MSSYSLAPDHYLDIHNWARDQKCGGKREEEHTDGGVYETVILTTLKLLAWEIFYATF